MAKSVPAEIEQRLDEARKQRLAYENTWAMCDGFYQGRQNVVQSFDGSDRIVELATRRLNRNGSIEYKEIRNVILPTVSTLVAKYNSRIPGWAVDPDTGDPVDIANARSSEHALRSQYDTLRMSRVLAETLTLMVNLGEGFIYPYWDINGGNMLPDNTYEGDTALRVLPPGAVLWEAGLKFEQSYWHGVELAFPKSYVEKHYKVKNPEADAVNNGSLLDNTRANGSTTANMVKVVEYLERPCAGNPGKRLIIVNNKVVEEGPYPYSGDGFEEVSNQPWLIRYSYYVNPTGDRDMGFTQHALDAQRSINKTVNQQNRNKDLRVNPPTVGLKGCYTGTGDWIPGHHYEFNDPEGKPETQEFPDATAAAQFTLGRADADLETLSGIHEASRGENPAGVDTASGLSSLIAQDDSQRAAILKMLAQSHSQLGTRVLLLLRKGYNAKRTMAYTGRAGMQGSMDFKGDKVPRRLQVRVSPGSLEHRTREQAEAMVMSYADREWIDPRNAMYAIDAGTAENILDDFRLDIEWQQRENSRMAALQPSESLTAALDADAELRGKYEEAKANFEQLQAEGLAVPPPGAVIPIGPWPHAREFDNHKIHIETLNRYRKTEEFDLLNESVKEAFQRHGEEHETFEAQAAQRQYEAQQAQAIEQGAANAARPTRERGKPSAPAPSINGQA